MLTQPPQLSNAATWPRAVRRTVDVVAGLVAFACRLGRDRAESQGEHAAMQAQLDAKDAIIRQQALELDMFRRRLGALPPRERPHFEPQDRLSILRLAWLNGWNARETAQRFVISVATVHRWLKAWHGKADPGLFFGKPPWNKLSEAVRDLIVQCRLEFPEPEIGTRTLAAQIEKAAIALSRSTVQRVLREPPPKTAASRKGANASELPATVKPFHILRPQKINRTWHLDLTVIRVWWLKFHVAALLDGYSRKLLALRVFKATPKTKDMLALMKTAMADHGAPRFLVTDHGAQFRKKFTVAIQRKRFGKIAHVKGKVRSFRFNGKLERSVRTLKLWQRVAVLFCGVASIQRALNNFRCWYNESRCHQALDGLTPEEAWTGAARPTPIRFLARDKTQHVFHLRRTHYAGDSHLPVFDIQITRAVRQSA